MLEYLRNHLAYSSRTRVLLFLTVPLLLLAYLLQPWHHALKHIPEYGLYSGTLEIESQKPLSGDHHLAIEQLRPKRVLIVGAGASGSSAAFFLRRAARVMEERIGVEAGRLVSDIVVVDKEGYVGGRSTTVDVRGDGTVLIEIGATIFVDANKHMNKAAKLFNLTVAPPDFGDTGVGIWNGTDFLYQTSTNKSLFSGWWDAISAVLRYGPLSPVRTNSAVAALLKKFSLLYNPKFLSDKGAARSINSMVERIGLGAEMTHQAGEDWALKTVGVGEKWMGEIMEGSTRVNYASDMNTIHAMAAGVSMATGGAKSIQGGNWQVFDGMLKNASATVVLGTTVTDVLPFTNEQGETMFEARTNVSISHTNQSFDNVIFAAPWHSSPISKTIKKLFTQKIPHQEYIHLHVTYIGTTRPRPDPAFFNLPAETVLPGTILTSSYLSRSGSGLPPPRFQSISWHGETYPGSGEYAVKIFSLTYLNDKFLHDIIGEEPTFLYRKEWDSYPAMKPDPVYAPVEPVKGFQYLAALEPWISTMETQTISGREAVSRLVEDWWGLGMGECRGGGDAWDWTCKDQ